MRYYVKLEMPVEAKDAPQARRIVEMALKRAGFADFRVNDAEPVESEPNPLIEDEEEDDFSDLD